MVLPPTFWSMPETTIQKPQAIEQQDIPTDLVPEEQLQREPAKNSISPYQKTEEGRVKFTKDMYQMGIELGLKPEAAKAFVAQKALESAWGTKLAAPYNFGGTKARPGEDYKIALTTEEENGKLKKVNAKFVSLKSPEDYKNRMKELLQLDRYKQAKEANTYSDYINGMVAGKYATDSKYKQKLESFKSSVEKRLK
jgi:flagellum-specific peptidoglycan hydrolase FlgJ